MTADLVAGRYRLEERLSATAMAEVWTATDGVLERRVVVKLLAPNADRPRFEREARAAAALAHPNVVQVFDFGEEGGRPYMVLEYLPGGTLAERLPEAEALSDEETRRIATDIAQGLAHAHLHDVVHRDLKPGNVLFDAEERAKVGDFGIARIQGTDSLTDSGTVLGTAAYMSPEQVSGGLITPATDVYAFGVLLYRMLTGRFPFESENALELARMHLEVDPPPIWFMRADAPPDLAALAMAALAKPAEARPADGASLLAALEPVEAPTLLQDAATALMPATGWRARRPPWRHRTRLAYVLAGVLLAGAGVVAAVVVASGSHSSAPPASSRARVTSTGHSTQTTTTPSQTPSTATTATPATTRATLPTTTAAPPAITVTTTVSTTAPTTTGP